MQGHGAVEQSDLNWISSTASLFPTTPSANSINSTEMTGLEILY